MSRPELERFSRKILIFQVPDDLGHNLDLSFTQFIPWHGRHGFVGQESLGLEDLRDFRLVIFLGEVDSCFIRQCGC